MPPHLHPRSTATSTLFAGTLVASFVVVALPHILPCPQRRRIGYQDSEVVFDSEGKPIKRIRKMASADESFLKGVQDDSGSKIITASRGTNLEDEAAMFRQLKKEAELVDGKDRECPIPKPKTLLSRLMGKQMNND